MRIISAGIVLYNPDIPRLRESLKQISEQVEELYLVDNNSDNIEQIKQLISNYSNVELILNSKNYGIATALNQIMMKSKVNNFEWVLLLDQDSVVPKNYIFKFKKVIEKNISTEIGIICPRINDLNSKIAQNKEIESLKEVDFCITSGTLNNLEVWDKVGRFDEKLFIDGVDLDYCIRLVKKNYKILQLNDTFLKHEIGKIKTLNILGFKIESFNHSAFRKYFIARNLIYIEKKHKRGVYLSTFARLLKQFVLVMLVEENKYKKIMFLSKGAIDGLKMKI